MTLPDVCAPAERRLNRLIHEALLRRIDPSRGPWWYPLEEAMGMTPGSVNPLPPKVKPIDYDKEWETISRGFKDDIAVDPDYTQVKL